MRGSCGAEGGNLGLSFSRRRARRESKRLGWSRGEVNSRTLPSCSNVPINSRRAASRTAHSHPLVSLVLNFSAPTAMAPQHDTPAATPLLSALLCCIHLLALVRLCPGDSLGGSLCREAEKEALLQFKRGLRDPANRLSSWVAGSDCCGWSGVGCDNRTGHVVGLDLRNPHPLRDWELGTLYDRWSLRGEIGPSLLGLKHLAYLDLSKNHFGGRPIPAFMGSLRQLTYLNLSWAGLGGIIPHHLGNLSTLQALDLSDNWRKPLVVVDDAGWVSRLSSLRQLNLQNVNVSSESNKLLEALNMLPSISSVNLQGCGLQSLPSSLPHVNFTTLSFLDLSGNSIRFPFPEWLPNITSLKYLDLGSNSLEGRIPSAIGSMSSLEVLIMSDNDRLRGELPRSLSSLCELQRLDLSFISNGISSDVNELEGSFSGCIGGNLQSLDLAYNGLRGSFPGWLQGLKRLKHLFLYGNSLQGPIPEFLGRISSLETLYLASNYFNGCIPHTLGALPRLTSLHLGWNHLQGSIPESLGGLSSLQTLSLADNNLTGTIPESLGGLSSLQNVYLQANNLSGTIPESLGGLSSLQILNLGSNNLSGTIPESLGGLSSLRELDMSFNHLEGTASTSHFSNLRGLEILVMASNPIVFDIKPDWVPPFKLIRVDMGSCTLGPLFPTWLRLQREVFLLNLSNSGISNAIPDSYWSSTSSIDILDLSNNYITGRLPDSLKDVSFLEFVNLRSNRLEGELPRLSSNITFLDMSNNSLAGEIPKDVCNIMPSLRFLSLSNNNLNGSIPRSLCRLQHLEILDLSRNFLSGDIPDCWKEGYSLQFWVLNFAHNALVGLIPSSLSSLPSLESLRLNHNSLSGKLPASLGTCSNIEILDLGENKFTGEIPTWVAEGMPSLKVLRLPSNNFTGNIPPNLSSLTYLRVIDLANNDLTGTIPPHFGNLTAMKFIHNMSERTGQYRSYDGLYSDTVELVIKGTEIEYQRLLSLVISIDLSDNRLSGSIPWELSDLAGLQSLNVSGNMLIGVIVQNIGALRWLECLDLSRNNLSGAIPPLMSSLTSMSHLNLSFNNLSGSIPTANQFHTFTDPSIYMGNPYLCGFPLDKPCEGGGHSGDGVYRGESEEGKDNTVIWMYLTVALGFILGFWVVCGTLIVHNRWRYMLFRLVDDMSDQVYVFLIVSMRRVRKSREK